MCVCGGGGGTINFRKKIKITVETKRQKSDREIIIIIKVLSTNSRRACMNVLERTKLRERHLACCVGLESGCYRLFRCCRRFCCCCCCAAAGLLFFSYDFKNESFSCWSSIVKTTRLNAISLLHSLSPSVSSIHSTEF